MKLTNRIYNQERFHSLSVEHLEKTNKEDALQWLTHPCTLSLRTAIQGDLAGILNEWIDGGYSSEENCDITAQREAKARGIAQALDDTLETIVDIGNLQLRGEINDNSSRS